MVTNMDKTYLKNTGLSFLTSVLSIFFIFYIINQVNVIDRNDVTIQYVKNDSAVTVSQLQFALFFAEETVASQDGYAYLHTVNNGTSVEKGSVVAGLYPISNEETARLIEKIDTQIAFLKKCSDIRGGSLDTTDYDKQVKDSYSALVDMIYRGNLSAAGSAGEDWLIAKSKRNLSIGLTSGYEEKIESLKLQREALLSGLGYRQGSVSTSFAGVYYRCYDGMESIMTDEIAKSGGYADLKNAILAQPEDNKENIIGKVVTSSKWYAVCSMPIGDALGLKTGNTYNVAFYENGTDVSLRLERTVSDYNENQTICVFSCDTKLSEFADCRFLTGDISVAEYSGLGVPCSAVRCIDGQVGVFIVDGNKARFRKIDIVAERGGRYIVKVYKSDEEGYDEHLKLYDSVITSGKNIYDGRYVELA